MGDRIGTFIDGHPFDYQGYLIAIARQVAKWDYGYIRGTTRVVMAPEDVFNPKLIAERHRVHRTLRPGTFGRLQIGNCYDYTAYIADQIERDKCLHATGIYFKDSSEEVFDHALPMIEVNGRLFFIDAAQTGRAVIYEAGHISDMLSLYADLFHDKKLKVWQYEPWWCYDCTLTEFASTVESRGKPIPFAYKSSPRRDLSVMYDNQQ